MDHPLAPVSRYATRCDFLFVGSVDDSDEEWVSPIELKEGNVRASEIERQLQAGADAAAQLVPSGADVYFRPVVASGRIHKDEQRKLRSDSSKIRFRGQSEIIYRIRCGDSLADILRNP